MLEPIDDLPAGVIGFEAVGEVHSTDYTDVLQPALHDAAARGGIRILYVLGERFEGYSAGAGLQDSKLAFEHHKAWRRAAIVTDVDWLRHMAALFGWMVPGKFKLFHLTELTAAIEWVAADEETT